MSDGPHRSLKMRLGWKKVAEFAANRAAGAEDVTRCIQPALADDWRADVRSKLVSGISAVLGEQQGSLLKDQKINELEGLRSLTAGHGFAQLLFDCAAQVVAEGKFGPDATAEAAVRALSIQAGRCARQVEEHYCRKTSVARAQNMRARIEEGISGASLGGLARQLLKLDVTPAPRAVEKQSGLDDGVRL
jgi:hypothetical protein